MLGDIVSPRRVFTDLEPAPKDELLAEMARRLALLGVVQDHQALTERLIRRERLMTTAVKHGFAFPHVFSPQVVELSLTIGIIREGTDYQSLDGKPVEFVFLLLGPQERQDLHLRLLARLSHIARESGMLAQLRQAESAEQIVALISESDRLLAAAS